MVTTNQPSTLSEFDEVPSIARQWHLGRWLAVVVIAILATLLARSVITNANFQWDVVAEYVVSQPILNGLWMTIWLSLIGVPISILLGVVVALMRRSPNPVLYGASAVYTWFLLSTPILVQVIFWFNAAALYPELKLSLPFGPELFSVSMNAVLTPFVAATIALSLHESVYMGEIIRGGLISVPEGQVNAAKSLGMTHGQIIRRIVLPQALRFIIPPAASRVITFVKNTSLISVMGMTELLYAAQLIYSRTYETIPLLIVASSWYLLVTTVLTIGQHFLERYYGRGSATAKGHAKAPKRVRRMLVGQWVGRQS